MSDFDFAVIIRSLPFLWQGMQLSLLLTALAMAGGIVLGTLLALMRLSRFGALAWLAGGYVNLFRSIPLILVIFWFYFLVPLALGQAVGYTLNMWPKLRRVFDYAEVELSNNLAENSMRPIALGRKNWLHVGSAKAGPKVAAILSVVESCRRLRAPVREYLLNVLPGLDGRKLSEIARLTPATWLAARG